MKAIIEISESGRYTYRKYTVVGKCASMFSHWLNSVDLFLSQFTILAKRMNMYIMCNRIETRGEGCRKLSTQSASMPVKLNPKWWRLIRFPHAHRETIFNSLLTRTDTIVNSCLVAVRWLWGGNHSQSDMYDSMSDIMLCEDEDGEHKLRQLNVVMESIKTFIPFILFLLVSLAWSDDGAIIQEDTQNRRHPSIHPPTYPSIHPLK